MQKKNICVVHSKVSTVELCLSQINTKAIEVSFAISQIKNVPHMFVFVRFQVLMAASIKFSLLRCSVM
jgi:hypothetical protein